MTKKVKEFITYVKYELMRYGATCRISKASTVKMYDEYVYGYWDEDKMELAIATNHSEKDWFPVFVHEFAHFCQWRDKRKPYKNFINNHLVHKYNSSLSYIFYSWLKGENYPINDVIKSCNYIRDMELDCEKLTLELIDVFNLKIDKKLQTKKAAVYIYFHNVQLKERSWYKYPPYNDEDVIKLMPNSLDVDFSKMPDNVYKIIKEKCM